MRELKRLNPDPNARIHIDTNGSILTKDYIDELVEAGMTDIDPDLKGYYPETFMRITAIEDKGLVERYLNTAWDAVRYLIDKYKDRVFIGIGIPYNKELLSAQQINPNFFFALSKTWSTLYIKQNQWEIKFWPIDNAQVIFANPLFLLRFYES